MKNTKLDQWLQKLDEESDQVGITKTKTDLGSEKDYKRIPAGLKKMWREYENAGGDKYESIWEFMKDVVGFLNDKGFSGREIAAWDKKIDKKADSDIAEK